MSVFKTGGRKALLGREYREEREKPCNWVLGLSKTENKGKEKEPVLVEEAVIKFYLPICSMWNPHKKSHLIFYFIYVNDQGSGT